MTAHVKLGGRDVRVDAGVKLRWQEDGMMAGADGRVVSEGTRSGGMWHVALIMYAVSMHV